MKNERGDITLILAVLFSVVTLAIVVLQQLIASQKIRLLYQISEKVDGYSSNEINTWRIFYRNKAGLTLDAPILTGSPNALTGLSYLSTGKSVPEDSVAGNGVIGGRYCAGSSHSKLCIGNRPTLVPIVPVVNASTWDQEAYVKASNADAEDKFGYAVSMSGDTLAVGAPAEASNETFIINGPVASAFNYSSGMGAVYIYKRSGGTWAQEAYLKANITHLDGTRFFGSSLSLDGDTLAVGAWVESSVYNAIINGPIADNRSAAQARAGGVYIYKRSGNSWAQEAYIKPTVIGGDSWFGYTVSLVGDTLAVGTPGQGSVYLFKRNGVIWEEDTVLQTPKVASGDEFGARVSLHNSTLAVGAPADDSSGAVYIYKRSNGIWAQEAYVKAANADFGDRFGESVSLNADTLVVGAIYESSSQTSITNGAMAAIPDNKKSSSGAVYVYLRSGGNWVQEAYIKAANARKSDNFGSSVFISGDSLAVGAQNEASNQSTITNGTGVSTDHSKASAGAVYVYKRTGNIWAQEAYVKAANVDANDRFGCSVQLTADSLVAGAFTEASSERAIVNGTTASDNNLAANSGAVYVYKRIITP